MSNLDSLNAQVAVFRIRFDQKDLLKIQYFGTFICWGVNRRSAIEGCLKRTGILKLGDYRGGEE